MVIIGIWTDSVASPTGQPGGGGPAGMQLHPGVPQRVLSLLSEQSMGTSRDRKLSFLCPSDSSPTDPAEVQPLFFHPAVTVAFPSCPGLAARRPCWPVKVSRPLFWTARRLGLCFVVGGLPPDAHIQTPGCYFLYAFGSFVTSLSPVPLGAGASDRL